MGIVEPLPDWCRRQLQQEFLHRTVLSRLKTRVVPYSTKARGFEDMRHGEDERTPYRRPPMKKPAKESSTDARDGDLDMDVFSRLHASRPEATPLDFVVRPQSKIDPDEIKACPQYQRRLKMNKKLQRLMAPKKKQLQATKLSIEGRGMTQYLW